MNPRSQKVKQMMKQKLKEKRKSSENRRFKTKEKWIDVKKMLWFQERLEGKSVFTKEEVCALIDLYLTRYDEELQDLVESKRNPSRQNIIIEVKQQEMDEYLTKGFPAPDLTKPKNVTFFRTWNGEQKYVDQIKLMNYKKTE